LVFIKISSIIKPEKILLLKPINWRGDYQTFGCLTALDLFGATIAAERKTPSTAVQPTDSSLLQ
ncbi:hypothetical protein E0H49_15585, partial [Rhizobium leguminosarum bv. viciae]